MTRVKLPPAQAAEIQKCLDQKRWPVLLEGPDGTTMAAVVPAEQALADEAEKRFGVRPRHFFKGRPVWTEEDRKNPAFRWPYPPEIEWVEHQFEEWLA